MRITNSVLTAAAKELHRTQCASHGANWCCKDEPSEVFLEAARNTLRAANRAEKDARRARETR